MSSSSLSRQTAQELPAVLAYTSVPQFGTARIFGPKREPDASANRPSPRRLEPLQVSANQQQQQQQLVAESSKVVHELIKLRKRLGWRSKLPILGRTARDEVRAAIDAPYGILSQASSGRPASGLQKSDPLENIKADDGRSFHAVLRSERAADMYDPYDLAIVSAEDAKKHRFWWVFTATTVATYEHDSMLDMEPTLQWLWDAQVFNALREIRTFRQFKMSRTFQHWRQTVQREKMERRQDYLSKSLFFADEMFYGCLYHVRTMIESALEVGEAAMRDMSCVTLVKTDATCTHELEEFMKHQLDTVLPQGMAQLRQLEERVAQLIRATCVAVAKQEQLLYAFDSEKTTFCEQQTVRALCQRYQSFFRLIDYLMVDFRHRLVARTVAHIADYLDASSHKLTLSSLEPVAANNEMTLENLTRKKKHTKAVFFVDLTLQPIKPPNLAADPHRSTSPTLDEPHHAANTAHAAAGDTASEKSTGSESELERKSDSESEIASESDRMTYTLALVPQRNDFLDRLLAWIEAIEQEVSNSHELREAEPLRMFAPAHFDVLAKVLHLNDEGGAWAIGGLAAYIGSVLEQDSEYQASVKRVQRVVLDSLEELESHAALAYTRYRDMVNDCQRFDEHYFAELDCAPEDLRGVLARFSDYAAQLRSMPLVQRLQALRLRAHKLQQAALPHPARVVAAVNSLLPHVAVERNNRLLQVIQQALKKLDAECETIDDFVDQLNFLERTASQVNELEAECAYVTRLFNVLLEFDLDIDPTQKALFRTLNAQFLYLKNVTTSAEAHRDERIAKFALELRSLISSIRLAPIKARLLQDSSANADTYKPSADGSPPTVDEEDQLVLAAKLLDGLNAIRSELEPVHARINRYIEYEQRFIQILDQARMASRAAAPDRVQLPSRQVSELLEQHVLLLSLKREYEELNQIVHSRSLLWSSILEWKRLSTQYANTRLYDLKVKDVAAEVNRMLRDCNELLKRMPGSVHLLSLRDRVTEFSRTALPVITALHNPALKSNHFAEMEEHIRIGEVDAAKKAMRNLAQLNIRAYKLNNKQLLVRELGENGILKYKEHIQEVSVTASNEVILEQQLEALVSRWQQTYFRTARQAVRGEMQLFLITNFDDLLIQCDDSLLTLATLRTNRYVEPIKLRVAEWDTRLQALSRALSELQQAQRAWRKLEPIFSAADIQRQLANETKLYQMTERSIIELYLHKIKLESAQTQVCVLKLVGTPGYVDMLQMCNRTFDKLERSLDDYLDSKRQQFARFYFLSNGELLDLLARSKDPLALQPFLPKLFANVHGLALMAGHSAQPESEAPRAAAVIEALVSAEGERLAMPRNTRTRGPAEQWMNALEQTMFDTVKRHVKLCLADAAQPRSGPFRYLRPDVLSRYVGQATCVVAHILFARNVRAALEPTTPAPNGTLQNLALALQNHLEELVDTLNHPQDSFEQPGLVSPASNQGLPPGQLRPSTLETLILTTLYHQDLIRNLLAHENPSLDLFHWLASLRFEWDEVMNTCSVVHLDASFSYGYEFLGAQRSALVVTPSTERGLRALSHALHSNCTAVLVGNAQTGKSHIVRQVAFLLGRQLITVAGAALEYRAAWKLISGVVQTGAWCLFERLDGIASAGLLSFVAHLLALVKQAKDARLPRVLLENRELRCAESCEFLATLQPQAALLGPLRLWPLQTPAVLRPVSLATPDIRAFVRALLIAAGFLHHEMLTERLFNFCMRLSSVRPQLPLGLRALNSLLLVAANLRRDALRDPYLLQQLVNNLLTQPPQSDNNAVFSADQETCLLLHCLLTTYFPLLRTELDRKQFWRVLIDVFAPHSFKCADMYLVGRSSMAQMYLELKLFNQIEQFAFDRAISLATQELRYYESPAQAEKAHQLYDVLKHHQCCVLLGETGSCKTTVRNIVQRALSIMPTIITEELKTLVANRRRGKHTFQYHLNRGKKATVDVVTIFPSFMSVNDLFGSMRQDEESSEPQWREGLFNKFLRRYVYENTLQRLQKLTNSKQQEGVLSRPQTQMTVQSAQSARSSRTARSSVSSRMGEEPPAEPAIDSARLEVEQASAEKTNWFWIVFDGSVDPRWADYLAPYLGEPFDARSLIAANGDRQLGGAETCVIFEANDGAELSPGLLSRCGTVYFERATCFNWKLYAQSVLQTQLLRTVPYSVRDFLMRLLSHSVDKALAFLRHARPHLLVPLETLDQAAVTQLLATLISLVNYLAERVNLAHLVSLSRPVSGNVDQNVPSDSPLPPANGPRPNSPDARSEAQSESVARTGRYYVEKYPHELNAMLTKLYVFAFSSSLGACFEQVAESEQELAVMDGAFQSLSTWVQREMRIQNTSSEDQVSASIRTFLGRASQLQAERERKRQLQLLRLDFEALLFELFDAESNHEFGVTLPASANSFSEYFVDLVSGELVPYDSFLFPGGRRQPRLELGYVTKLDSEEEYRIQLEWLFRPEYTLTTDVLRNAFLLTLLLKGGYNVLVSGPLGIGKTTLVTRALNALCATASDNDDGKSSNMSNASPSKQKHKSLSAKAESIFNDVLEKLLHFSESNQLVESPSRLKSRASVAKSRASSSRSESEIDRTKITSFAQMHIQLSPSFKPPVLFNTLKRQLVKRSRDALGPATKGQQMIVFLDDLHSVHSEPAYECFRQFVDARGYFDNDRLSWVEFQNCSAVLTSGPLIDNSRYQPYAANTETRRSSLNGSVVRLLRRFCLLHMQNPTTSTLQYIVLHQLNRFWMELQFSLEVREALTAASQFLVNTYLHCSRYFPQSFQRSFASFSLHDFWFAKARCFYMHPQFVRNREQLWHFLVHELQRTYSDRLVTRDDRELLLMFLLYETQFSLRMPLRLSLPEFSDISNNHLFGYDSADAHSVDHISDNSAPLDLIDAHLSGLRGTHTYQQVSIERCAQMSELESRYFLERCPEHTDLVMHREAAARIFRLVRILKMPKCCFALFGRVGVDKHKMVRLACALCDIKIVEADRCSGNAREFFRSLLKNAMLDNQQLLLLIDDYGLKNHSILEGVSVIRGYPDNLVENFFSHAEIDELMFQLNTKLINEAAAGTKKHTHIDNSDSSSGSQSREDLLKIFAQRTCLNINIAFLLDPNNEQTRNTVVENGNMFFSLPRLTYEDELDRSWLQEITSSILNSLVVDLRNEMASAFTHTPDAVFSSIINVQLDSTEGKASLTQAVIGIFHEVKVFTALFKDTVNRIQHRDLQRDVRSLHALIPLVCETQFVEMLQTFRQLMTMQAQKLLSEKGSLLTGLKRLKSTKATIFRMQEHLEALVPQIKDRSRNAAEMQSRLESEQVAASEIRTLLQAEDARLQTEHAAVKRYEADCEAEFRAVLPVLEQATLALGELSKQSIAEVRAYTYPPAAVVNVMTAICTLLEAKPDWLTARQLLVDPNRFVNQLIRYDRDNVSNKVFANLRRIVMDPQFNPDVVGNVSMACRSLCEWVIAMTKYVEVSKMARPKRERFEQATQALEVVGENYKRLRDDTRRVEELLQRLQEQHAEAHAECQRLARHHEMLQRRLANARHLTDALDARCAEWVGRVEAIDNELGHLGVTSLLRAAAITFAAPLSTEQRRNLLSRWFQVVHDAMGGSLARLKTHNSVNLAVHGVILEQTLDLMPANFDLVAASWNPLLHLQTRLSALPVDNCAFASAAFVTTLDHLDAFRPSPLADAGGLALPSSQFTPRFSLLLDPHQIATRWIANAFSGGAFPSCERLQFICAAEPNFADLLLQSLANPCFVVLRDVHAVSDQHALAGLIQSLHVAKLKSRNTRLTTPTNDTVDNSSIRFHPHARLVLMSSNASQEWLQDSELHRICCCVPFELTYAGVNDLLLSTIASYVNRQEVTEISRLLAEAISASVAIDKLQQTCLDRMLFIDRSPTFLSLITSTPATAPNSSDLQNEQADDFESDASMLFDDEKLLENLDEYSRLKDQVQAKLEKVDMLKQKVDDSLQSFQQIAAYAASLYQAARDMYIVDPSYYVGLETFLEFFSSMLVDFLGQVPSGPGGVGVPHWVRNVQAHFANSLQYASHVSVSRRAPKSAGQSQSMSNSSPSASEQTGEPASGVLDASALASNVSSAVLNLVMGGLRQADVDVFLFMLVCELMRTNSRLLGNGEASISDLEWSVFVDHIGSTVDGGIPDVATQLPYLEVLEYVSESFHGVTNSLKQYMQDDNAPQEAEIWKRFMASDEPYSMLRSLESAGAVRWQALTSFQRILLVELLRPSKLRRSLRALVQEQLPKLVADEEQMAALQSKAWGARDLQLTLCDAMQLSGQLRAPLVLVQVDEDVQVDAVRAVADALQGGDSGSRGRSQTGSADSGSAWAGGTQSQLGGRRLGQSVEVVTLEQLSGASVARALEQLVGRVQLNVAQFQNLVIDLGHFERGPEAEALRANLRRLLEAVRWNAAKMSAGAARQRVVLLRRTATSPRDERREQADGPLIQQTDVKVQLERFWTPDVAECVAQNAATLLDRVQRAHQPAFPADLQSGVEPFLRNVCILNELASCIRLTSQHRVGQSALRTENSVDTLLRQLLPALGAAPRPDKLRIAELLQLTFTNGFAPLPDIWLSLFGSQQFERVALCLMQPDAIPFTSSSVHAVRQTLQDTPEYHHALDALGRLTSPAASNTNDANLQQAHVNDGLLLVLEKRSIDAAAFAIEHQLAADGESGPVPTPAPLHADLSNEVQRICLEVRSHLPFQIDALPSMADSASPDAEPSIHYFGANLQAIAKLAKTLRTNVFDCIDYITDVLTEELQKIRTRSSETSPRPSSQPVELETATPPQQLENAVSGVPPSGTDIGPEGVVTEEQPTPDPSELSAALPIDKSKMFSLFVRMLLLFRSELSRYNQLLFIIHESTKQVLAETVQNDLQASARALINERVQNLVTPFSASEIESIKVALLKNQVPELWLRHAELPVLEERCGTSLRDWMHEVGRCVSFFNFWSINFLRWCDDIRVPLFVTPTGRSVKAQADAALHDRGTSIAVAQQAVKANKAKVLSERLIYLPLPRAYWMPAFSSTEKLVCSIFNTASIENIPIEEKLLFDYEEELQFGSNKFDADKFIEIAFAARDESETAKTQTWSSWSAASCPTNSARIFGSFFEPR